MKSPYTWVSSLVTPLSDAPKPATPRRLLAEGVSGISASIAAVRSNRAVPMYRSSLYPARTPSLSWLCLQNTMMLSVVWSPQE
jgi:hypothetical protein